MWTPRKVLVAPLPTELPPLPLPTLVRLWGVPVSRLLPRTDRAPGEFVVDLVVSFHGGCSGGPTIYGGYDGEGPDSPPGRTARPHLT